MTGIIGHHMAVEGGTSFCDCDTKVPFENVDLRFEPLIDPSFHHTRYPTVVFDKTYEASIEDQKIFYGFKFPTASIN